MVRPPDDFKPVKNCWRVRVGIAVGAMCPKSFPGDNVLYTVAIHVDQVDRVELRKYDAVFVLLRLLVHHDMLFELNLAILLFAELLVPR